MYFTSYEENVEFRSDEVKSLLDSLHERLDDLVYTRQSPAKDLQMTHG